MKNQIRESIFSKPIMREFMEGTEKRYVISGPFTMADRVNGNGRIYPKEVLNRSIAQFREMVKQKRVKMSLDHADWSVGSLKDTAAILTDISDVQDDGFAYYEAQIIDTTRGKDLKVILDAGAMVGVSTVAIGSFLEDQEYPGVEGKHPVMQDGMCLKKVDFVDDPSVSETEGRMQLESRNGTCYVLQGQVRESSTTVKNPKKENKMKTFEELKAEFPVIAEFESRVNSEKKDLETKLVEAKAETEQYVKISSEAVAKAVALESKINEMVTAMKTVVPEAFNITNIPETDLIKQKDQEIATAKTESTTLSEELKKAKESYSELEKKIVASEKAQAIAKLQATDPDYFKSKTAVKAFENCANADEVKLCYEHNKAIMAEQAEVTKGNTTPEPGKTTVVPESKSDELTEEEKKDFQFVNIGRVNSSLPKWTVAEYRESKKAK